MRDDQSFSEADAVEAEPARARPTRRVEYLRLWATLGLSVALVIAGARFGDSKAPLGELLLIWTCFEIAKHALWQPTLRQPTQLFVRALGVILIAACAIGAAEVVGDPGFLPSLLIYSGLVIAILYVPFDGLQNSHAPERDGSDPALVDRGSEGEAPRRALNE